MLATHPSLGAQKKDLHVGGLGSSAPGAPVAIIDPMIEAAGSWMHRTKAAARTADGFVSNNPWTALAIVAVVGLAAGYLLSQRSHA